MFVFFVWKKGGSRGETGLDPAKSGCLNSSAEQRARFRGDAAAKREVRRERDRGSKTKEITRIQGKNNGWRMLIQTKPEHGSDPVYLVVYFRRW